MTQQTFSPNINITEVVIVGLGGTGSQLARTVCRVIYDLRRRRKHFPKLRFVDFDRVEMSNIGRQLFVDSDCGQYKAEVLAKRFSRAMGLDVVYHNEPFDAQKHTLKYGTLVCGCVDNHEARIELAKVRGVWIEAGNTFNFGSVIIGNSSDPGEIRRCLNSDELLYVPNAALVFPNLLEGDLEKPTKPKNDASCAELMESGDQDLLVNDAMGNIAGAYVYKLLNQRPIHNFITYVDADGLAMRSIPVCRDEIMPYVHGKSSRSV